MELRCGAACARAREGDGALSAWRKEEEALGGASVVATIRSRSTTAGRPEAAAPVERRGVATLPCCGQREERKGIRSVGERRGRVGGSWGGVVGLGFGRSGR